MRMPIGTEDAEQGRGEGGGSAGGGTGRWRGFVHLRGWGCKRRRERVICRVDDLMFEGQDDLGACA
jgi:hypothetical protein